MKNKLEINLIILLILVGMVAACKQSGEIAADNSLISSANTDSRTEPETLPTPRNMSATQLLTYLKANETETGKMLTDREIIVFGDVWKGGSWGGGSASFEFWSTEGRITCAGENNDAAKLNLLEKSTGDYLSKRVDKMPLVKAKGVYKKGFSPAAPPNNFWSIVLENCTILEVIP